jgi:hypothetical protein
MTILLKQLHKLCMHIMDRQRFIRPLHCDLEDHIVSPSNSFVYQSYNWYTGLFLWEHHGSLLVP